MPCCRSLKCHCIRVVSSGGATGDPPSALATSPTTPLYCLVRAVQMSASLFRSVCLVRASRFFVPSLDFSACQFCAMSSVCRRRCDSPSGSCERADPQSIHESTGTNLYLATCGRRVSPRHGSNGHCMGPGMRMCSSTYGLVDVPRFFVGGTARTASCVVRQR